MTKYDQLSCAWNINNSLYVNLITLNTVEFYFLKIYTVRGGGTLTPPLRSVHTWTLYTILSFFFLMRRYIKTANRSPAAHSHRCNNLTMIALKSISEKRLAFLLVLAFMFNSLFPIVNLMVCHSHQQSWL